MSTKPLILIVEDDKAISRFIKLSLESQDYQCIESSTAKMGYSQVLSMNPNLILLDLGLPDMDGLNLITKIRELSPVKIIVISARNLERDKVTALDYGADDYLTKPFSIAELLARVRVALRNQSYMTGSINQKISSIKIRDLNIDIEKHIVTLNNVRIHLTPIEFQLLKLLAEHSGRVLTHKFIIENIWGNAYESETQSLRVFMASLRRKIEVNPAKPLYLLTEIGLGYRMIDE